MQRCVVDDRSSFRFSILAGENAELLFRAGILARKAKQLKQENALRSVGRVLAEIVP